MTPWPAISRSWSDRGPGTDDVAVDSLVRTTSGLTWQWEDPDSDHPGDPARDVLGTPPVTVPDTAFAHRGGTYLLRRTGRCSRSGSWRT